MRYGDEHFAEVDQGFNPDELSRSELAALFHDAPRITAFESTPDHNFIHDLTAVGFDGSMVYRINRDCMIEINNAYLKVPSVIRNQVADLISFQFVSTVKRSEYLGKRKNVHDLMGEAVESYPVWLAEILSGQHTKPRQRVFFLEDVHRDSIWSCFHLPVSGSLLGQWMSAKFDELLCIGLQILKNSRSLGDQDPLDLDLPDGEKIRRARTILGMKYANPPPLPDLARQLGISETRLKSGFKTMNGTTVMQYCIHKRIEAARFLLKENHHSISEIGNIVGYEDHSAFSRAFRRHCGYSPREWQHFQGMDSHS
jgi:AraC-like DNA-binding protein